jgi:peptide/nickel transport system substrate-binding protein
VLPEVSADLVPFFRDRPGYAVHARTGPHLWFLILNARRPPFSDPRARRAVNLAVDREKMVEQLLGGTASVAASVVPAAFGEAHAADLEPYAFDPARARALLDESGARGASLNLIVPTSGSGMLEPELMAAAIQADLSSVGLEVSIRSYEWNAYLAEVNAGLDDGVHMAAMAWMTNDPDTLPYLTLRTAAQPPGGFNSGWYSNPELDRLIDRARSEIDRTRRNDIYRRIDRMAHADAPFLFVASWRQIAVARERVRGLSLQPSFFLRFAEARAD